MRANWVWAKPAQHCWWEQTGILAVRVTDGLATCECFQEEWGQMVLPPAAGVPLVSVVSKELRTHWVNLLEMGPISTLKKERHLLKAWELTLFGEPFSGSRNILGSHLDKENCGCLPGWICPPNNGTGSSNWVFLGLGLLACQDNNQL